MDKSVIEKSVLFVAILASFLLPSPYVFISIFIIIIIGIILLADKSKRMEYIFKFIGILFGCGGIFFSFALHYELSITCFAQGVIIFGIGHLFSYFESKRKKEEDVNKEEMKEDNMEIH